MMWIIVFETAEGFWKVSGSVVWMTRGDADEAMGKLKGAYPDTRFALAGVSVLAPPKRKEPDAVGLALSEEAAQQFYSEIGATMERLGVGAKDAARLLKIKAYALVAK